MRQTQNQRLKKRQERESVIMFCELIERDLNFESYGVFNNDDLIIINQAVIDKDYEILKSMYDKYDYLPNWCDMKLCRFTNILNSYV